MFEERKMFRNGVIAMTAPRMTTQYTSNAEIQALNNTMTLDCLYCILRAGRSKAARWWRKWRNKTPIEANGGYENCSEHR